MRFHPHRRKRGEHGDASTNPTLAAKKLRCLEGAQMGHSRSCSLGKGCLRLCFTTQVWRYPSSRWVMGFRIRQRYSTG
jgi:hypothetical protein